MNRQSTASNAAEDMLPVERLKKTDVEAYLTPWGGAEKDGAAPLPLLMADGHIFSALDLRDRVVIMLLFDQVVREDQVKLAWQLWHRMSHEGTKEPLWRVLTLFPDLDRELIYAEAARVYGFEEARISRVQALGLIKDMQVRLDQDSWDQMVEFRLMPISEVMQKHSHRKRFVFASPDPTLPEVHRLLSELDMEGFELRYAREDEILNLLIEAFPYRYNHLRGLSGVTKDFLAAVYPDEESAFEEETGIADPVVLSSEALVMPSSPSSLSIFEDVLVDAVRHMATDVCLLPHPAGQTDVYYQVEGQLTRHRIIEHIPSDRFVQAIKSSIIRQAGASGMIKKRLIQRWVDDALVRFRVSAIPANEDVHAECIVVRVYA